MKKVLCYGDSNTYGYNPHNGERYQKEIRWTFILSNLLDKNYEVIEEGLNGRTTAFDRDGEDTKNGFVHYSSIYEMYKPVDVIVFMLGTNDCGEDMNLSLEKITNGMEKLIVEAKDQAKQKQECMPKIILVVPAAICGDYTKSPFAYQLSENAIFKSKQIAKTYKQLSIKHDCIFLDASNLEVSNLDCEHLTEDSHNKLAHLLFEIIKEI